MKPMHVWTITTMLGIFPGCAVNAGQDPEDSPLILSARAGELEVHDEGSLTTGSFRSDRLVLEYSNESRGETGYEVTLTLNGASLTAFGDGVKGAHLLDGFAVANGEDTQLSLEDRGLILSFARTWERANAGKAMSRAQSMLLRAAELWVEYPNGLPLQREVISDEARDVTQLCGQYLAWHPVTHDCNPAATGELQQEGCSATFSRMRKHAVKYLRREAARPDGRDEHAFLVPVQLEFAGNTMTSIVRVVRRGGSLKLATL